MTTALVTGGAGFIGSSVVEGLVERGHNVTVLDNLSSGYRSNLDRFPSVRFLQGDVRDPGVVADAIKRCEVIFHLAASVGNKRSIDRPIEDSDVNVIGTLRILEAARVSGVRKIIVSSSAGIFGELKTLPIREDHPLDPDTPYGCSKLAQEKLCLTYAKLYGIEAVALRYFNVYGQNQRYDAYGNVIPIFAHRILQENPITIFGDGEQTRDFVNVRDIASANLRAAEARGVSGAFNIASGSRISITELARLMYRAVGREPRIEYAPPRPGDVRHSLADISAARQAFGYQPTVTLEEGIQGYLRWASTELVSH